MIGPCAIHVPMHRLPAHVIVVRAGRRLADRPITTPNGREQRPKLWLQRGDRISVSRPARFTFTLAENRYVIPHGHLRLVCRRLLLDPNRRPARVRVLAVLLESGRVEVHAGPRPRHALVLTAGMLTLARTRNTAFVVERNPSALRTRAWTRNDPIVSASASDQTLRITVRPTYTAISDSRGLRLDIWPFSISPQQRPAAAADGLVPFWADGRACSVGCTPPGAIPGWPFPPFHAQHAIRAGLNELRPANFHVAVDIEAHNGQQVYAIQSGIAHIRYDGSGEVNVDVGQFDYWHIHPEVREGQFVTAYRTRLGAVLYDFKHVAFSEVQGGEYLNPLRPGGSLRPYSDSEPPIIGVPRIFAGGRATLAAFDPQSFVEKASFETPVLAPAALAWRLYDLHGRALTGLQWALRGSHNYPPGLKPLVFAPGASNPGYACFAFHVVCVPNWNYWLAGGLAPPLPLAGLVRGRYRLTVYAWDWAGNTSALDDWITLPLAHLAAAPSGPLVPRSESR